MPSSNEQRATISLRSRGRAILVTLAPWLCRRLGLCFLLRKILWRNRAAILFYHDPQPEILDKHLQYLGRVATIVPFSDLWTPHSGGPRAVITIDDGMLGNLRLKEVFQKHGVRPMIYVCTGIVATGAGFWWVGRERSFVERLKEEPDGRRKAALRAIGFEESRAVSPRQAVSIDELREMSDWADLGAHTRFHPILTRCEADHAREEIAGSKTELAPFLGVEFRHFAYPNGSYSDRDANFVKEAGFESARTCDPGWNSPETDPFRLKGIYIDDSAPLDKFALQITGVPALCRHFLKSFRAPGRADSVTNTDRPEFADKLPSINSEGI